MVASPCKLGDYLLMQPKTIPSPNAMHEFAKTSTTSRTSANCLSTKEATNEECPESLPDISAKLADTFG